MTEGTGRGDRDGGRPESGRRASSPDRAVSEFTGVAILVGITVLVTASVGISVIVADHAAANALDANFSFQYIDESSTLVITFDRGNPIDAGNMTVRGQGSEASWHVLAGSNETAEIGPGTPGSTVQISRGNAFGSPVSAAGGIEVVYVDEANETVLDRWQGI